MYFTTLYTKEDNYSVFYAFYLGMSYVYYGERLGALLVTTVEYLTICHIFKFNKFFIGWH